MKGISIFIYVLIFSIWFIIDSTSFLSIAGSVQGVPAQVWTILDRLHTDLSTGDTATMPQGMRTFISDCILPAHNSLDREEIVEAVNACQHPQNASVKYPGVVCVFYDYHGHIYKFCKGLRQEPVKSYLFDGSGSPVFEVSRNTEERSFELIS